MKLFKEKFSINLPEGILYYPCAGGDTKSPIDFFGELVKELHFSDINKVILPYLDCGLTRKVKKNGQWQRVADKNRESERKSIGIYERADVVKAKKENVKRNLDVGEFLRNNFNLNVGDIRVNDIKEIERWKLNEGSKDITIVTHCLDGILTLLTLQNISVFFYRNDTCDYRGTNQLWFSRNVFDKLVDRLVDGAIIVTDGSNYNPNDEDVPWKVFWRCQIEDKNFKYKHCEFEYLGIFEEVKNKTVGVWRVKKY